MASEEEFREAVDHSADEREEVVLRAVVDVSEATEDQQAMYHQMADIFGDAFETFVRKNMDYGSSFQTAGQVDQALDNGDGPFDSVEEANLYKVFTRIQDKDQRFFNLVFCHTKAQIEEDPSETAIDAGVYWFMVAWMLLYGGDDGS